MKKDIEVYMVQCMIFQNVKIPEWKWDIIYMYFIIGLFHTLRRHDLIWVIMDWLTKLAYFFAS